MVEIYEHSSKDHSEKILTIKKGQELKISVSEDIRSPTSFMHTAYCQAVCAVAGIDDQTQRFHSARTPNPGRDLFDDLFQYSGNIVAFAGPRGGGKTSTMLSFAKLLGEGQLFPSTSACSQQETALDFLTPEQVNRLKCLHFISFSPIAPSVLEEKQSILTVVLSRLYSYISGRFNDDHHSAIPIPLKQEVAKSFQECLAGLRGVKHQMDSMQEDFAMLQDVSDGMALRVSFHHLVQNILKAVQNGNKDQNDTYLVLQLDDADSQLKVGYDVLEDIRKYLMLPNVIILTSADFDMLRRVVLQRYLSDLSDLAHSGEGPGLRRELSKAASKYIDKLIPPSNLICLPSPESILMRWGLQLKLRYGMADELKCRREPPPSLQTELLRRIYRKTGIVFTTSTARPHDIVPTTLRGINQLLYLLSGMLDLPPYIPSDKIVSPNQPAAAFLDHLATYIETEYLPVADTNLQQFADYFVQDWINARILDAQDRDFLFRMERSTTAKVQLAIDYLKEKYDKNSPKSSNDVVVLDRFIAELSDVHYKREDLSLLFAVKVLITLENHMWVLQQKRASIHDFHAESIKTAFQPRYFTEGTYLPCIYQVEESKWEMDGVATVFNAARAAFSTSTDPERTRRYDLLSECLIQINSGNRKQFSLVNIITFFLRLSELDSLFNLTSNDAEDVERLLSIYCAQETALRIAANWDIWTLLKESRLPTETATANKPGKEQLSKIFMAIDSILSGVLEGSVFDSGSGINVSWNSVTSSLGIDQSAVWNYMKTKGITPGKRKSAGNAKRTLKQAAPSPEEKKEANEVAESLMLKANDA